MEVTKIISDSSPLISFSSIGELPILNKLFPKGIIIPQAVWDEVVSGEPGKKDIIKAVNKNWIKIIQISDHDLCALLINKGLDKGESEAITLANEKKMPVLLDETDARQEAKHMKLSFTGTVGCLLKAKEKSIIPAVKPHLDSMVKISLFRISPGLYYKVLKQVGE